VLELTEIALYLPQLPPFLDSLAIVHFSDLHTRRLGPNERRLARLIQRGCDLATCSGDSCWDNWYGFSSPPDVAAAVTVFRHLLAAADRPAALFAVQGNHDPKRFMDRLADLGVGVLANETRRIELPGRGPFNLSGIRCARRKNADICRTLLQADPGLFTICICHYPELAEALAAGGVDLILTGHTHGGQICLPGRRPMVTHSRVGRRYSSGLSRIGPAAVYTTRGIGYSIAPVRLFCPPEAVHLTLRRGDPAETTIRRTVIS